MNLWYAKSRSTPKNMFLKRDDFVEPPDRNQSVAVFPVLPQCKLTADEELCREVTPFAPREEG